jgi:cell division protein FtsI (penicillin-binding protein 3)
MPDRHGADRTQRPDVSRRRALVVAAFLCLWMVVIGARLAYLQTAEHERLAKRARAQQTGEVELAPVRGLILDRRGRELARSVGVQSFFAAPAEMADVDETAGRLAAVLGLDAATLAGRIRQAKEARRSFVWLARKVTDEQARSIAALNLKGIHSTQEQRRRYPNGPLAAHVLGFVGLDEKGLAGIEQVYDAALRGEQGRMMVGLDARRAAFESEREAAEDGRTIVLTLDQTVQHMTETALNAAVERSRAKSGAAIVLDPRTGEILALANAPAFDPNTATGASDDLRRNDALQNIYEPGSTFKIVAFAGALEEKLTNPEERIDCLGGGITVAGRFIRDHTPYGMLTATEALAKSSNVAAIKLGMRLGNEGLYGYMRRFGFGERTGVELPGETRGILRPVPRWHGSSIGSLSIGQEIGVTPVQVAAAFAAIANDGVRVAPHLVREIRDAEGRVVERARPESHRVVSAETAQVVRGMLEAVTISGTAKRARLEGYTAAGKTGTAQKIDPQTRAYSKTKHIASFVGIAPVENPSVVIIVVIDEPVGAYHGGDTAAPVFREIADMVLPYLDVTPDDEFRPGVEQGAPRPVAQASAPLPATGGSPQAADGDESAGPSVVAPRVADGGAGGEVIYAASVNRALLMPDLRGRSVRDVARICAQLGLELEARGEGRALSQSPAVGARLETGQVVRVEFGRGG